MRILLLSATTGYQLRSFNEAAARVGVDLVFATDRCHTLDDPWQDAAVPVRFQDEDDSLARILAEAERRPFVGIVAVGDRPAVLAARAAEALGLPGHPPAAVRDASSKLASRGRFAAAGLITPWFLPAPEDQSPDVIAHDRRITYPCVVKPTGLSGSRGVIRADDPAQCAEALRRVRALLARPDVRSAHPRTSPQIIVEGFIAGREYAMEGLMSDGQLRPLAVFEKPDPLDGPFFEETIYVTPPGLEPHAERAIVDTVQQAVTALGLRHGAVHAECRVNRAGVVMLEVAPRPIGGLCSRVLRFAAPAAGGTAALMSLEELLLRHALHQPVSAWGREAPAAAVMMIPIPSRGHLKHVEGEAAARAVEHVEEVLITAKRDQLLETLPEAGSYLGFIFARASTASDATRALRAAHRRLSFVIQPAIRVRSA
jgi:biotin carboxylase